MEKVKVSDKEILDLIEDAKEMLADPDSEDVILANYNYPLQVNSETLISLLEELQQYRKGNK